MEGVLRLFLRNCQSIFHCNSLGLPLIYNNNNNNKSIDVYLINTKILICFLNELLCASLDQFKFFVLITTITMRKHDTLSKSMETTYDTNREPAKKKHKKKNWLNMCDKRIKTKRFYIEWQKSVECDQKNKKSEIPLFNLYCGAFHFQRTEMCAYRIYRQVLTLERCVLILLAYYPTIYRHMPIEMHRGKWCTKWTLTDHCIGHSKWIYDIQVSSSINHWQNSPVAIDKSNGQ